jgi:hypothetical protein
MREAGVQRTVKMQNVPHGIVVAVCNASIKRK